MRRLATWSLAIVFVTIFATQSHASIVGYQAVSGTATSNLSSSFFDVDFTFDKSALSSNYESGVTPWATIATIVHTGIDSNTSWFSENGVTDGYLQYDMGQVLTMDRVRLFWVNINQTNDPYVNSIGDFTVEVSNDASFGTSTLVLTDTGGPNAAQADYLFTSIASGRYLRINWTSFSTNNSRFAGLNEIIVGGEMQGSSAVPEPSSFLVMLGLAASAGVGYGIKRRRKTA